MQHQWSRRRRRSSRDSIHSSSSRDVGEMMTMEAEGKQQRGGGSTRATLPIGRVVMLMSNMINMLNMLNMKTPILIADSDARDVADSDARDVA